MSERSIHLHLILSAIIRGAHTLEEISSECGGLYPFELRELLAGLIETGQVILSEDTYNLSSPQIGHDDSTQPDRGGTQFVDLPEPHPLDYDWRFDAETSKHVAETIVKETAYGTILLLGAPSVYLALARLRPSARAVLLDWSSELIHYLSHFNLPDSFTLVNHDVFSGVLWESSYVIDAVVCDPPWYPEYYTAFFAQATFVSQVGAAFAVSLLPINARPQAHEDRWKIIESAHKLGLHIQTILPNTLRYETPIFERMSLNSSGIEIIGNWRRGDLAIFRKVYSPTRESILEALSSVMSGARGQSQWAEMLLGRYKIKLRGPFDDHQKVPELISIEEGDILQTVSRRYKRRELVDLWLWDNRVFAVKGKAAFWAAVHTLAGRPMPQDLNSVPSANHDHALELLGQILGAIQHQR